MYSCDDCKIEVDLESTDSSKCVSGKTFPDSLTAFLGGISACYCGYTADLAIAACAVLLFLLISIPCV